MESDGRHNRVDIIGYLSDWSSMILTVGSPHKSFHTHNIFTRTLYSHTLCLFVIRLVSHLFVESSAEVARGLPGGSSNSSGESSLAWGSTKSKRRFGFGVRAERRKTGVARVDVLVSGVVYSRIVK